MGGAVAGVAWHARTHQIAHHVRAHVKVCMPMSSAVPETLEDWLLLIKWSAVA